MGFFEKIFGDPNEKEIKKANSIVDEVNALEKGVQGLSDAELQAKTAEFREAFAREFREVAEEAEHKLQDIETREQELRKQLTDEKKTLRKKLKEEEQKILDRFLPEAFAVVREASVRTLGMRHFDVQILGGIILHQGRIAEMKTGEGKTLVATLPAYLNAITGKGVHIITVNDYLARRDSQWMGEIYKFLGLTVGLIVHGLKPAERREAYNADITYGTNNEFGFDYLRDNMVIHRENLVQRSLNYAIVDEVDSILVDEARTPLIISGQAGKPAELYKTINTVAAQIVKPNKILYKKDKDEEVDTSQYFLEIDEKAKSVELTEAGQDRVEKILGRKIYGSAAVEEEEDHEDYDEEDTPDPDEPGRDKTPVKDPEEGATLETMEYQSLIRQALKAHTLMKRDREYVVKDGEVIIVDEFTGRLMFGRRYSDGLHQAIEAKEGVKVARESQTLASITFQNYFRMYRKLAGMTGTAKTEEDEFIKIYNLDVVVIPTNEPMVREDLSDAVYKTERGKFGAVVEEIVERHRQGQPQLVGTISIEKSEELSRLLSKRGVRHNVLNAKHHEREAEIVMDAGQKGAVTIATNMAGRGTDIVLGGNIDDEREAIVGDENLSSLEREKKLADLKARWNRDHQEVVDLGGLHIIGTERHEARRIDNQLRGRSGRQGDPGSSQFYISLEDDLMRLFGGEMVYNIMDKLGVEEDIPIDHPMISKAIENAQKKVEARNFDIRKHVLEYDDVMNQQREVIYEQRRRVLEGEDVQSTIQGMIQDVIGGFLDVYCDPGIYPEEWDLKGLLEAAAELFLLPGSLQVKNLEELEREEIRELLHDKALERYRRREQELGTETLRELERVILLRVVDSKWMNHIDVMDNLRQGIGLRAYGQRHPLMEYKKEAYEEFNAMIAAIREDVAKLIYRVQVIERPQRRPVVSVDQASQVNRENVAQLGGGEAQKPRQEPRRVEDKVGRNAPCPCGSGKKYKKCCG